MSLSEKFIDIANDICTIINSDISLEMKKNYLKTFTLRLDKLNKMFSIEERNLYKIKMFESHLTKVFACQEQAMRMLDKLQIQIEEKEAGLS